MDQTIVMVDMSATIIHHGHVRLLAQAKQFGSVMVALTTDEEIHKVKGYIPELAFEYRKEILLSMSAVSTVVPAPWAITLDFLDAHGATYLVHGSDNVNKIPHERLLIFDRTYGVSSSKIRKLATQNWLINHQPLDG